MAAEERQRTCAIRSRDLVQRVTGLAAMAQTYPNARICGEGCTLRGRDLSVQQGVGRVTIKAEPQDARHQPRSDCELERFQDAD